MEEPVLDAEVVPEEGTAEMSTDLVASDRGDVTLFQTTDPVEVIQKASAVASALRDVLRQQGLTTRISGKDHVQVEGWQTLGSMIGVFPVKEFVEEIAWPDPIPPALASAKGRGLTFGFKASFRAQRADGAVVGGGEAECRRTETKWKDRDDFALKSMAQTRATSKTLKAPLGFIVTLAGYASTPAEEMDNLQTAQFGPAFDGEQEKFTRALTYITNDAALSMRVKHIIEEEAGGYLPKIAARTILHTARSIRDKQETNQEVDDGGSDDHG